MVCAIKFVECLICLSFFLPNLLTIPTIYRNFTKSVKTGTYYFCQIIVIDFLLLLRVHLALY